MDVKRIAASLLVTGGLLFCPQTVPFAVVNTACFAEKSDESLWEYKIVQSEEGISSSPFAEITKCKIHSQNEENTLYISIPSTLGGYPVKKLGSEVFEAGSIKGVANVQVPDSLICAEPDFTDEFNMLIFTSVDGIEYEYFGGEMYVHDIPEKQKDIYIPDYFMGIEIVDADYQYDWSGVENVRLPNHMNYIPRGFDSSLKSINIPKNMHIIPSGLFNGNDFPNLENVEFHDDVYIIARDSFVGSKVIPPQDKVVYNIKEIKNGALTYWEADVETGWCYIINLNMEGKPVDAYIKYAPDLQGATPSSYKGIPVLDLRLTDNFPDYMPYMIIREGIKSTINFHNNTPDLLTKVDIRSTDVEIDRGLFKNTSIEELSFPGSADVGFQAAHGCEKLKKLEFVGKDAVVNIRNEAFYNTSALEEVSFSPALKELVICGNAFYGSGFEEVTIPAATSSIGDYAFGKNKNLKNVTIKGSSEIGKSVFCECPELEEVVFEREVKLGDDLFAGDSKLSNIVIDISKPFNGKAMNDCSGAVKINGEEVFNKDGSPVEKYRDFIEKNFKDSENSYIIDNYVMYRVREAVKETVTDDMSDVEKIKALHDKVCSLVYYDKDDKEAVKNHVDASVFLNDSSVCEGYAKAYNLMLHEAGIESYYVYTEDHAWVVVKIGDNYFHVDPTWDDGDEVGYNWFMLSDSQVSADDTHRGFKLIAPSPLHDFQGKKLPECRYRRGDVNCDDVLDAVDASAVLTNYARASLGETMTIAAELGDYNFDGTVNAVDASAILSEYAKNS